MQNNNECRENVDEMFVILRSEESTHDEKYMALRTIIDALYLSYTDAQRLIAKYCPELLIED